MHAAGVSTVVIGSILTFDETAYLATLAGTREQFTTQQHE